MDKEQEKKLSEKNIYILGGVEDFLTTTARIHKRNLLYSSLICLMVSLIAYNKSFDSIFGFKVTGDEISADIIILMLIVVCCYEFLSLWQCLKTCKSHWQGESLLNLINSESESKEPDRFKKLISASLLIDEDDKNKFSKEITDQVEEMGVQIRIANELASHFTKSLEDLTSEYAKAAVKHTNQQRQLVEISVRDNREYVPDSMKENFDQECYRVGKVFSKISDKLTYIDHMYESHREVAKVVEKIKICSTDWEKNIENKLSCLGEKSEEVKNILHSINGTYSRQVQIHFIIPTIIFFISFSFGIVALNYPVECEWVNNLFIEITSKLKTSK
ncbi:hypothetical protein [Vibrio alginolyticus]|uniref:hypothetical protein n=1 Tax=Vibrio alginolyticus TaxID=663 RepID=UPI003755404D